MKKLQIILTILVFITIGLLLTNPFKTPSTEQNKRIYAIATAQQDTFYLNPVNHVGGYETGIPEFYLLNKYDVVYIGGPGPCRECSRYSWGRAPTNGRVATVIAFE